MAETLHSAIVDGKILVLEIDNPPMNAMNAAALARLSAALEAAEADHAIRAIVLTGRGRAFCSGADLKDAASGAGGLGGFDRALKLTAGARAPVIAAVNGHCIGGGLELALCCDIRIASTTAQFVCAGVNMGLMASTYRLPRLIGTARAKAMLLTGLPFDAATAERWGLVTALHAPEELNAAALALAQRIATRAPLSVEAAKRTADRAMDLAPEEAATLSGQELRALRASQDHREAVSAFVEKRTPNFERR